MARQRASSALEKARKKAREKLEARKKKAAEELMETAEKKKKKTPDGKRRKKRSTTPARKSKMVIKNGRGSSTKKQKKTGGDVKRDDILSMEISMMPSVFDEDSFGWHASGTSFESIQGNSTHVQYAANAVSQMRATTKRVDWFEENAPKLTLRVEAQPDGDGWTCKTQFSFEVDHEQMDVQMQFRAVVFDGEEEEEISDGSAHVVQEDGWGIVSSSPRNGEKASSKRTRSATKKKTNAENIFSYSNTQLFVLVLVVLVGICIVDADMREKFMSVVESARSFLVTIIDIFGLFFRKQILERLTGALRIGS